MKEHKTLWEQLSEDLRVNMTKALVEYPNILGRSVKELKMGYTYYSISLATFSHIWIYAMPDGSAFPSPSEIFINS